MKHVSRIALILCILSTPALVSAETVVRTGETVSIATEQRIESDFYAAASSVTHTGVVAGDMYAAGASVTMKGVVEADVFALAAKADIDGEVADDVRVVAGETTISGTVAGDVFVIAGSVQVLPTAEITGDVYVFAGDVTIEGAVGGSVRGSVERIRIDAPVAGEVDVIARTGVTLGARAEIEGTVSYTSQRSIVRAPEAVVNGDIIQTTPSLLPEQDSSLSYLVPALIMLFGSLVLYLLGRSFFAAVVSEALTRPTRSGVYGLGMYIVGPLVAIAAIITVLGLAIGIGLLGLCIVLYALSYTVAPMVLGVALWRVVGTQTVLQPFAILLGVVALQLLLFIPILGGIIAFLLSVVSAGALVEVVRRRVFMNR